MRGCRVRTERARVPTADGLQKGPGGRKPGKPSSDLRRSFGAGSQRRPGLLRLHKWEFAGASLSRRLELGLNGAPGSLRLQRESDPVAGSEISLPPDGSYGTNGGLKRGVTRAWRVQQGSFRFGVHLPFGFIH
jgi:hypothetical protein